MNKKAIFFVMILGFVRQSFIASAGTSGVRDTISNPWLPVDQVGELAKWISQQPYLYYAGITLGSVWVISKIQKDNPDFFGSITRALEWPFFVTQKKLQKLFCNGKSLTWNELASWHNRVYRLLSPLTKTASVIDLGKDRRLRVMDAEMDQNKVDEAWIKQVAHIEREVAFLSKVLHERLRYYEDQVVSDRKKRKKSSDGVIKFVGKVMMRTSLNRNEEIAFGLKEVVAYLTETVEYCRSVSHASALDKEHLKKLVGSLCATFEHLGALVDEVSASDRNKKKIAMVSDVTRGYAGVGGGSYGYGGDYGSSGYGYGAS